MRRQCPATIWALLSISIRSHQASSLQLYPMTAFLYRNFRFHSTSQRDVYHYNLHPQRLRQQQQRQQNAYFHPRIPSSLISRQCFIHNQSTDSKLSPTDLAKQTMSSLLSMTGRTWKRLQPVITLATSSPAVIEEKNHEESSHHHHPQTIADIGCDHGILTYGLAASSYFEQVIGVDVSKPALQMGGWTLVEQLGANVGITQVHFLLGDGLQPLLLERNAKTVDIVCIAGMGVQTMIQILQHSTLMTIGCHKIIIQPTNSRPRHLMQLYRHIIDNCGFTLEQENIDYVTNRWYITSSFVLSTKEKNNVQRKVEQQFLGHVLSTSQDERQTNIYKDYVSHHINWIRKDSMASGTSHDMDKLWLDEAQSFLSSH
jgi:tRNA A22 N-methylase